MSAAVEAMSEVDELLRGAVDLRCEMRPADYRAAALAARAAGMRALAVVDPGFSPTPALRMLERAEVLEGLVLIGSVVLNDAVGGLNPFAVEHDFKLGGRIVGMPTVSALNHHRRVSRGGGPEGSCLTVLDDRGRVTETVREILELIAEHDAVLAFGHLHISEIWPLHEAALAAGVRRQLLTDMPASMAPPAEEIAALTRAGVVIECCEAGALAGCVSALGADRVLLTSGGASAPPMETLRDRLGRARAEGVPVADLRQVLSDTPGQLVGL